MSSNLELVRSIYADWERGDFTSTEWADPEIEFEIADGPDPGRWHGLTGMTEGWRGQLSLWEDYRGVADDYREVDRERVLVLGHFTARSGTSGLEVGQVRQTQASLFQLRDERVTRLVLYWDRDRAFADLGLAPERASPPRDGSPGNWDR